MFLVDRDYERHTKAFDLGILTKGGDQEVRNFAENATAEQMKSALRLRYEADDAFIDITLWNVGTTYNIDDHVEYDIGVGDIRTFYALQANTGVTPSIGVNPDWMEGDKRNKQLVMLALDMAMFHMFAKIPQRQTPEDIQTRYGDAITWLDNVSKGRMIPDLPKIERTEENGNLFFGGPKKIDSDWQT